MAYYRTCQNCGCNLDPGEKCICQRQKGQERETIRKRIRADPATGQLFFRLDGKEGKFGKKIFPPDHRG